MIAPRYFAAILLAALVSLDAFGQSVAQPLGTYQERKAYLAERFNGAQSSAEKLDAMRSVVRAGPVGQRGLTQIFGNFNGARAIDPDTPGVGKVVVLSTSSNAVQARGHRRELVYAQGYFSDSRFDVVELGKILRRHWGNTDADLVIRHRATGALGRVEIKEISPETQHHNLSYYKGQMDKMAREAAHTGQLQFWLNRRPLIPELEAYAERLGIEAYGNVKTGQTTHGTPFESVRDLQDRRFKAATFRSRQSEVGRVMATNGAFRPGYAVFESLRASDARLLPAARAIGNAGSMLGGGAFVTAGGAPTTARSAMEPAKSLLVRVARVPGAVPIVLAGVDVTSVAVAYRRADVSTRDLVTTGWVIGMGTIGSWVGGKTAAVLVTTLGGSPPLAPLADLVGATAGYVVGSELGVRTADAYYDWRYEGIDRNFGRLVYAQYGVAP